MIGITKELNGITSKEEQVFDVETFNDLLHDKQNAHNIIREKKNFVEYINKATDIAFDFSLYENIYINEYVDKQRVQSMANSFYNHIKKQTLLKNIRKKFMGMKLNFVILIKNIKINF